MSDLDGKGRRSKPLPMARRQALRVSDDALVTTSYLRPDARLPLVVVPSEAAVDLIDWEGGHRAWIDAQLDTHGGILFRGFPVDAPAALEQLITATADGWAEYREPATPRSQVSGNIYTSTDYPAAQSIFLHNENSHTESWPLKIYFCCMIPAQQGGETPIADCRAIFAQLDPAIRERFREKQVLYVRNLGAGVGFPWQQVFKTDDKAEAEAYCRRSGIKAEWTGPDQLRISYVRPAMASHPRTGEMVWFNHATFFHISTMEPAIREGLLATMREDELPYNTFYGDGTAIEPEVLDALRAAYHATTVAFPWQAGDVMLLDNMLVAHGRSPYVGPRRVLVGMAEPCRWADIEQKETERLRANS
jgi:alpha-ketoglutarate-dependent taurine dioxygenase